jgi:hypothetical protein
MARHSLVFIYFEKALAQIFRIDYNLPMLKIAAAQKTTVAFAGSRLYSIKKTAYQVSNRQFPSSSKSLKTASNLLIRYNKQIMYWTGQIIRCRKQVIRYYKQVIHRGF